MSAEDRITSALDIAAEYGQTDGEHHKAWVIDRMVRALTGPDYDRWVSEWEEPEDPDDWRSDWDEGTPP